MPVPERPVLVAPDSFKGTFSAPQVAGAIGRGLERAGLMPPDLCPLADGGEGTMEALMLALGGARRGARAGGAVDPRRARLRRAHARRARGGDRRGQARPADAGGQAGRRDRHAIVGRDELDAFGKRIIDLMRVIEATDLREMEEAGEALGKLLAEGLA